MNKFAIVLAALPLSFLGAGFAAGSLLIDAPATVGGGQEDPTAPAPSDNEPALEPETPEQGEAAPTEKHGADARSMAEDRTLVRLGQMTIPVEKSRSVAYVVADIALKATDIETADHYIRIEVAARLRSALISAMHDAADTPVLRDVSIDSNALSRQILNSLAPDFAGIEQVLFISLYKQDVPRG